jgi:hypothetical protein
MALAPSLLCGFGESYALIPIKSSPGYEDGVGIKLGIELGIKQGKKGSKWAI